MISFTSGGAAGADYHFAVNAIKAGCKAEIMSFHGHNASVPPGAALILLSEAALAGTDEDLALASRKMVRRLPAPGSYARKLIQRNHAIVRHARAVYAVGKFVDPAIAHSLGIDGGTAWGCELFEMSDEYNLQLPLFFFDMGTNKWHMRERQKWVPLWGSPPHPCGFTSFAGIGSRDITPEGVAAIEALFA